MFYIPQPRRFTYKPRFYDPEKERREERRRQMGLASELLPDDNRDLEYYERKLEELDNNKNKSKLTWRDMFRKREMPKFNYKPRFATEETPAEPKVDTEERMEEYKQSKVRIQRRFKYDGSRKQQRVWVKVGLAVIVLYLVYRYYGLILQFIYSVFFKS